MASTHHKNGISRYLVAACLLGSWLAGCTTVGPNTIRSGRMAYNDAIAETNNQQLLRAVVDNRYSERGNLLAVASVTANVRVRTSTGVQLGFGDSDDYAGNLVPFSAGAVYEENPTISYVPVEGEKYTAQLFSPVPVPVVARFAGTLTDSAYIFTALISSVNGIRNPDFQFSAAEPDERFERFVEIMTKLTRMQRLYWIQDPQRASRFSIVIDQYAPAYSAEVSELLELLGLHPTKHPSAQVVLPVFLALDGRASGGVGIITRSVWDLVEILSAAIEVPEDHLHNGIAASYPSSGLVGKELRIHRSKDRPKHAAVAVNYRDGWFYIDDTDLASKRYFRLMGALWSAAIAKSTTKGSAAPVLTVPVSR